jgi:hypothetical protein
MILRLGAVAAIHGAAGVAMDVTGVLAACTVAQVAKVGWEEMGRTSTRPSPAPPSMPTTGRAPESP